MSSWSTHIEGLLGGFSDLLPEKFLAVSYTCIGTFQKLLAILSYPFASNSTRDSVSASQMSLVQGPSLAIGLPPHSIVPTGTEWLLWYREGLVCSPPPGLSSHSDHATRYLPVPWPGGSSVCLIVGRMLVSPIGWQSNADIWLSICPLCLTSTESEIHMGKGRSDLSSPPIPNMLFFSLKIIIIILPQVGTRKLASKTDVKIVMPAILVSYQVSVTAMLHERMLGRTDEWMHGYCMETSLKVTCSTSGLDIQKGVFSFDTRTWVQ